MNKRDTIDQFIVGLIQNDGAHFIAVGAHKGDDGHAFADLIIQAEGATRLSNKGLSVRLEDVGQLIELLQRVQQQARELGWLRLDA